MEIIDWKKLGVTWNDDGSATIKLTFPINVGGTRSTSVQMHSPSLDQATDINNDDEGAPLEQERRAISSLIGLAEEEMGQIKWPDYRRIQKVYAVFFNDTPPGWIGGEAKPKKRSSSSASTSTNA